MNDNELGMPVEDIQIKIKYTLILHVSVPDALHQLFNNHKTVSQDQTNSSLKNWWIFPSLGTGSPNVYVFEFHSHRPTGSMLHELTVIWECE